MLQCSAQTKHVNPSRNSPFLRSKIYKQKFLDWTFWVVDHVTKIGTKCKRSSTISEQWTAEKALLLLDPANFLLFQQFLHSEQRGLTWFALFCGVANLHFETKSENAVSYNDLHLKMGGANEITFSLGSY